MKEQSRLAVHVDDDTIATVTCADALLDQAISKLGAIETLLFQGAGTRSAADTQKALQQIAGG